MYKNIYKISFTNLYIAGSRWTVDGEPFWVRWGKSSLALDWGTTQVVEVRTSAEEQKRHSSRIMRWFTMVMRVSLRFDETATLPPEQAQILRSVVQTAQR